MATATETYDIPQKYKKQLIPLHNFSWGRFVMGIGFFALLITTLYLAFNTGSIPIIVLAAVVNTFVISSLFEWLVHGIIYHAPIPGLKFIYRIHAIHHFKIFPIGKYVQYKTPYEHMYYDPTLKSWRMAKTFMEEFKLKGAQVGMHFFISIIALILPTWLITGSLLYTGTTIIASGFIAYWLASVHGAIHSPKDRWFERMSWFQWLNRHHYVHHIDVGANVNFMLPLADFIFGSRKAQLTADEEANNPTFDEVYPNLALKDA